MNKNIVCKLRKVMAAALIMSACISLSGCRGGDDTIPTLPPKEVPKQIAGAVLPSGGKWLFADGEIVEDETMVHIKDGQSYTTKPTSFYVTEHSNWESTCANTYYQVIIDRKDEYDKDFFEKKILVCAVDTAYAGQKYQFEGVMYAPENGSMVLTVYMSYDDSNAKRTLANYYNFLEVEADGIGQIDKIKVETFIRAK